MHFKSLSLVLNELENQADIPYLSPTFLKIFSTINDNIMKTVLLNASRENVLF